MLSRVHAESLVLSGVLKVSSCVESSVLSDLLTVASSVKTHAKKGGHSC